MKTYGKPKILKAEMDFTPKNLKQQKSANCCICINKHRDRERLPTAMSSEKKQISREAAV